MKGNRTSIIAVIVTMVAVFCLMASGLPQRFFTAVTIGDTDYSVAQFRLYYYNEYYDFLLDHTEDDLTSMGLLSNSRLHRQESPYGMSWFEYFKQGAEDEMVERYILEQEAINAGYTLSEEGLAAVAEEHDMIVYLTAQSGLNDEKDYLQRLYQPGTTVDSYYEEYERGVLAEEYKQILIEEYFTPSESEVEALAESYAAESADAYSADIAVIRMDAKADRFSETVEDRQIENLRIRGQNLLADFEETDGSYETFLAYAASYSEEVDVETNGGLHKGVRSDDYPLEVAAWYTDASRKAGDVTLINTGESVYLIYYVDQGEKESILDARASLTEDAYVAFLEEKKASLEIKEHFFGMRIAR